MLTTAELALALGVTRPTCARWLTLWHSLGVRGIARVRSRGRAGFAYVVDDSFPQRWRNCELPVVRGRAA